MNKNLEQKIKFFFDNLSASNCNLVDDFYDLDAHFIDPLVNLKGRKLIKNYYYNIYKPVEEIDFDFIEIIQEGYKYSVFWTMNLKAPKLNSGKKFAVSGMSLIIFSADSQLVEFQRDYYDLGEFIYERVPVLSTIIRFVKNKLSKFHKH